MNWLPLRMEQQSMKMKSSCGIFRTRCKHWSYSLIFDYPEFWFNDILVYNSSWCLDWPCSHLPGCQFLTSWHPTVPSPRFSRLLTSEAFLHLWMEVEGGFMLVSWSAPSNPDPPQTPLSSWCWHHLSSSLSFPLLIFSFPSPFIFSFPLKRSIMQYIGF